MSFRKGKYTYECYIRAWKKGANKYECVKWETGYRNLWEKIPLDEYNAAKTK